MRTPLESLLLEGIRRDGPITFAAYMEQALYHPDHGYYSAPSPRTGWSGHYVTSAEIGPVYGELWARGLRAIWDALGRPSLFEVVEVGAGEAGFAAAMLAALDPQLAAALTYRLIERNPALRRRQEEALARWEGIEWSGSLEDAPRSSAGVVLANEVLDNLPVHLVTSSGGELQEVWVKEEAGRLGTMLGAPSVPELEGFLERCGLGDPPEGSLLEMSLAAGSFVTAAAALHERGALVFTDYGKEASELAQSPEGTLVSYSGAGADDRPLERPGEKDITAHVNWTAVKQACRAAGLETTGPLPQQEVLRALGIEELRQRLEREQAEALTEGRGADALKALSGRQAAAALLDPGGLGAMQTLIAATTPVLFT